MNKVRLLNTFLQLVKISSPSAKEENIREYVVQELEKLGIHYSIDKTGNVYAAVKGVGDTVLFAAHLDTVEPCQSVSPVVKGKWITSAGKTVLGADNKVAVAAILETLQATNHKERKNIEVIFSVKEETEGGINTFNFKKLKSTTGLVADSGLPVGSIVLSSPFIVDFLLEVTGREAHSSEHELGVNALAAASQALAKTKLGKFSKDTIVNIGTIHGGQVTNTVPGKIVLKGEIRSFSKSSLMLARKDIVSTFSKEAKKLGGFAKYSDYIYCTGYNFSKNHPQFVRIADIMKANDLDVSYHTSFGGSDANALVDNKILVINIGEGAQNIHTSKERVSIDSLEKLTSVFIDFCKKD